MLCEQCQQNTAEVLITQIESGKMTRTQLCPTCALPVLESIGPNETAGASFLSPTASGEQQLLPDAIPLRGPVTVEEFSAALHLQPYQVVGTLMRLGITASRRDTIDEATAADLCMRYGVDVLKGQ
jgi:hypothetical protein